MLKGSVIFVKKVLIILTGGTIGSQSSGGVLDTDDTALSKPVDVYREKYGCDIEFEIVSPLITLSENMTPSKIGLICKAVKENILRSDISGIIVTHGSDTLSYTANVMAYVFSGIDLPVVLVASNKEFCDKRGNGLQNFKNAIDFINTSFLKGVFVSWSNDKEDNTIYFASDICEADAYFDSFSSYDGKICGKIVDSVFKRENDAKIFDVKIEDIDFDFKKKVLLIKPYPGLDYNAFDLSEYSAVVHYLYHSSTACVEGDDGSVLRFIDKCQKHNIRFFIAPVKKDNEKIYSSFERILRKNYVEVLYECSAERAYAYALIEVNKI